MKDIKDIKEVRALTQEQIRQKLSTIEGVRSITFVGSFVYGDNLSVISDIDIIVIVDKLTGGIFDKIEAAADSISGDDCGLEGYDVKLNMSFGPLKLNSEKTIVFHLMIYDVAGHHKHVTESPFTCLDWEYYPAIYGDSLSAICPSVPVQLQDIIGTRRGLESYLTDLEAGVISYRNYVFDGNGITEKKSTYAMDERHKKEYAYHIMKFLMLNFLKIIHQQNTRYTDVSLAKSFALLDQSFEVDVAFFLELSGWKYGNENEPASIYERVKLFIDKLSKWFSELLASLPRITFIRHGKTDLNDGSFLGVGRNPDIIKPLAGEQLPSENFDIVYTSTLQRTISTGQALRSSNYVQTELLNEIDYGKAEGITFGTLQEQFPDLVKLWAQGADPEFPDGESQEDVMNRLEKFINQMLIGAAEKNIAVVTHNVVIRALLGKFYQSEIKNWYRLAPGHLEQISFRIFNNSIIPELTREQRIRFREQLLN